MSKSKEEINALKEDVESVNKKIHKLTSEELEQVNGGIKGAGVIVVAANSVAGSARYR